MNRKRAKPYLNSVELQLGDLFFTSVNSFSPHEVSFFTLVFSAFLCVFLIERFYVAIFQLAFAKVWQPCDANLWREMMTSISYAATVTDVNSQESTPYRLHNIFKRCSGTLIQQSTKTLVKHCRFSFVNSLNQVSFPYILLSTCFHLSSYRGLPNT